MTTRNAARGSRSTPRPASSGRPSKAAEPLFAVDPDGLRRLVAGRAKTFAVCELVQNAWDADVAEVAITIEPVPGRPLVRLAVEDDDPNGFADLAHAYTLFARSVKGDDPTKRGRFNLGEKLVIALCEEATITTTTGTVSFGPDGRRHFPRRKRDRGSRFEGVLRMTRDELTEVDAAIARLIGPENVQTTYNGVLIGRREPVATFEATLPTVRTDEEGVLRPTRRKTTVSVFEPLDDGEPGKLYELGIPVVETGDRWDVSIGQKVPLDTDRTNVTPAFLREVRARVLDAMHEHLRNDADAAATSWVSAALDDPTVSDDAVTAVLDARYGERRVAYDPSDPEGSKLAVSRGYTVVHGGAFSGRQWDNIKRAGALLPAGQVTPSPRPYSDDPDAPVRDELHRGDWTPEMERIVEFSALIGERLTGARPNVKLINDRRVPASATYCRGGFGGPELEYNVARLGRKWFEQPKTSEPVLSLLLHELGHHYSSDHLSSDYYNALTDLGARLARLALAEPELFA